MTFKAYGKPVRIWRIVAVAPAPWRRRVEMVNVSIRLGWPIWPLAALTRPLSRLYVPPNLMRVWIWAEEASAA